MRENDIRRLATAINSLRPDPSEGKEAIDQWLKVRDAMWDVVPQYYAILFLGLCPRPDDKDEDDA